MDEGLLRASWAAAVSLDRPGLALTPEAGLGIAKVQLFAEEDHKLLAAALGGSLPAPRTMAGAGSVEIAWLAPGEWLLLGEDLSDALLRVEGALAGRVALVTDLTHGRAAWRASGPDVRDVLAALCPLDLSESAFPVGSVARSLLGEAGLFLARLADLDGAPVFRLIVDQTMAGYATRMLAGPVR